MKNTNLIKTWEAAEYLGGLEKNTLEGWRIKGIGPRYIKVGRLVRYRITDLDEYIESQICTGTSKSATALKNRLKK